MRASAVIPVVVFLIEKRRLGAWFTDRSLDSCRLDIPRVGEERLRVEVAEGQGARNHNSAPFRNMEVVLLDSPRSHQRRVSTDTGTSGKAHQNSSSTRSFALLRSI